MEKAKPEMASKGIDRKEMGGQKPQISMSNIEKMLNIKRLLPGRFR